MAMVACNCPKEKTPSLCCSKEEKAISKCCETKKESVLRHVVLFEWNDSTSQEKREELINHFASLKEKIDVIQDFEYGSDVSVEGLTKGYNHCFIVTFKDTVGRNTYLPHPDHKVFGDSVVPHLKNVLVVDYLSQKE